jgi:uncharacterized protein YggE
MKLFVCALLFTVCGAVAQTTPPRSTVQATGTASVSVTPDQATINVSAVTSAATAQEAANQNATLATTIQQSIAQALGSSGSVKTIGYSVSPNYNFPRDGSPAVLTGYTVTNSIQVTLNDLTIVGKVIDSATSGGASRVDSLQFTLKDDTDARSQALKAAVVKAKAKADAMAGSLGLKTSTVLVIQESGAVVTPLTGLAPTAGASTPVTPGQLTVTGNVTISVEMQ